MTRQERKAAMALHEVTQASVVRETGFSDSYVHEVIYGTRRNEEIERVVAKRCKSTVEKMFGPRPKALARR